MKPYLLGLLPCLLPALCPAAETWSYWIQPCPPELTRESGCHASDPELARWALDAWAAVSSGRLSFAAAEREERARIRIYWAPGNQSLYGEAHPIEVDGRIGAAIHVRPDLAQLGPEIARAGSRDRLFRDTVVYLTCVHESGHALGLPHTARFADIMYSFGFGGDILEYFERYRRQLGKREDIRRHSGIGEADRAALERLHGSNGGTR